MRSLFRLLTLLLGLSGVLLLPVQAAAESPRMAMGLIVKLKDAPQQVAPQSVVRLQAAGKPRVSAQAQRLRLASAAQRHRVGYLLQRPTAFAAQVIHNGYPVPYEDAAAQAARLRADPDVEWVIVNEMAHPASVTPNDPGFGSQTWLGYRDAAHLGVANFPAAWAAMDGRTLSPVVVAVLDTGILNAPDLDGRLLPGYDFVSEVDYAGDGDGVDSDPSDPGNDLQKVPPALRDGCATSDTSWHGLSVAAMLAARAGNGLDGAGMLAPLAAPALLPVRVGGLCGAEVSDIIEGMLWAAGIDYNGSPARNPHPARVINLSFGGDGSCESSGSGVRDAAWLYRDTIATLKNNGVLVVASAGNGSSATGLGLAAPTRPANCPGVLAVTGLNDQGYKARYASLVPFDGVHTFGVAVASGDVTDSQLFADAGIVTLSNTGTTSPSTSFELRRLAGTSFAAPTAAGVAALMLAVDPSLTVDDLLWALTHRVLDFPAAGGLMACSPGVNGQGNCNCTAQTCGGGVLDAYSSVTWAITHADQASGSPSGSQVTGQRACFTPERLGGGDPCAPSSSGGGGGGGAMALWELLLLGLAVSVSGWCRIRGDRG